MNLEHEFTVPAPVDEAWKVLLDVEKVAPCMPGATLLSVDGDSFTGTVKVKVGPIQVTYKGEAKFVTKDEASHSAVLEASGKESRGSGTAGATVTTRLEDAGGSTQVKVVTDLNITGRPAQFGRGVMSEVASKVIDQFAACLAEELGGGAAPTTTAALSGGATQDATADGAQPVRTDAGPALPPTATAMTEPAPAPAMPSAGGGATSTSTAAGSVRPPSAAPRRTPEAIDLIDVAGGSVAKRLIPLVAGLLVLAFVWRRLHR